MRRRIILRLRQGRALSSIALGFYTGSLVYACFSQRSVLEARGEAEIEEEKKKWVREVIKVK
jgi:hypothetical protein